MRGGGDAKKSGDSVPYCHGFVANGGGCGKKGRFQKPKRSKKGGKVHLGGGGKTSQKKKGFIVAKKGGKRGGEESH